MLEVQEMTVEAPEADSPYSAVIKTWARWMTLKDDVRRSAGLSHPQDVKEFMACGEAVDTMVNDLAMHQRWAIRKSQRLATLWIFPDVSYPDTLTAAEAILIKKMIKNVATRRYFN